MVTECVGLMASKTGSLCQVWQTLLKVASSAWETNTNKSSSYASGHLTVHAPTRVQLCVVGRARDPFPHPADGTFTHPRLTKGHHPSTS
jgi:hypothetical protein